MPRMFTFDDDGASFPGAYFANAPREPLVHDLGASFQELKERLTGEDRDLLIELYEARRPYSEEEVLQATRPLIQWGDGTATPIRKDGEAREGWR